MARSGGSVPRTPLLALLALLALAACQQTPASTTADSGTNASSPTSVVPTDDRTLRFQRVESLIFQWDAAQAGGRVDAAEELRKQAGAEVDAGFDDFAAAAQNDQSANMQYLGVIALGFASRPEATSILVGQLTSRDPTLLANALISLKLRADPNTDLIPVLKLINAPWPDPKRYAPLVVANVFEARRQAGRPTDPEIVRSAAHLLSGVVADRDPFVRLHVAKALGAVRSPGTYELLLILLKDEHIRIRVGAAAALERLGDPRGFGEVIVLLNDAPEDLKPVVRDVLISYAGKVQGQPLTLAEAQRLDVNTQAWASWFNEYRRRTGLVIDHERGSAGNRP
ncbi:MAG: HEAT repeat domain-containing protein, partial [Planctomycetota bacterium]